MRVFRFRTSVTWAIMAPTPAIIRDEPPDAFLQCHGGDGRLDATDEHGQPSVVSQADDDHGEQQRGDGSGIEESGCLRGYPGRYREHRCHQEAQGDQPNGIAADPDMRGDGVGSHEDRQDRQEGDDADPWKPSSREPTGLGEEVRLLQGRVDVLG